VKQPKIKIFGHQHKVMQIEFNKEGSVEKIIYQVSENVNKTVFRGNTMINKSLISDRKIHAPTEHPYHDYAYAPDLESLLC
jgi:Flp pilus assembly CpaF family ATPase